MESRNGNDRRAPIGFDARTYLFMVVVSVWAIVVIMDALSSDYEVPSMVHYALLGIVGYFVGDRLKGRNGGKTE